MSHHRGPKTTTQDLIFHYDTGNEKSLVGEPTTNLVDARWSYWNVDGSGQGSIGTRTILSDYHCRIVDVNSNTRHYISFYGISANTTYTFSVKFKKISGPPTLRFQIQPYNDGTYITSYFPTTAQIGLTDIDGWQTAKYTLTTPANTNRFIWFVQDGDDYTTYTHSFEIKDVQCEAKSHVTPFTPGTRSNTQGLIDLSKRSVMTVANASFDSNAMLNFDGTNDYIQLTSFTQPTNYITCEAWINPQDLVTPGTIRGGVISSTNSMYLGIFDSYDGTTFGSHWAVQTSTGARPYNINGSIPRNKWTHLVGTYNGSVSRAYINGVEVWNASLTGTIPSATYYIGTYGGTIVDDTHNFNGYISVAKIYNRALTAEQVYQNYNASKSRFGL
jgi:hypothetical protein